MEGEPVKDDDDTAVIERPPTKKPDRQVGPTEPKQPNGWRCESCNKRSSKREELCYPVPA